VFYFLLNLALELRWLILIKTKWYNETWNESLMSNWKRLSSGNTKLRSKILMVILGNESNIFIKVAIL